MSVGLRDSTYVQRNELQPTIDARVAETAATDAELAEDVAELRKMYGSYNVKDVAYGAVGNGVADDTTAITKALEAANSAGGGVVQFPAGTYLISSTLTLYSNVALVGDGWGTTKIKLKNASNTTIAKTSSYETTTRTNVHIEGITFDGNKAGNTSGHGLLLDVCSSRLSEVNVLNPAEDGITVRITTDTGKEETGLDNHLYQCRVNGAGRYGFRRLDHDGTSVDCQAIQCRERGFSAESNGLYLHCHSWCYSSGATCTKTGWYLEGPTNELVNCTGEGAETVQVKIIGNNCRIISGDYFDTTGKPNVPLIEFAGGAGTKIVWPYLKEFGTSAALKFTSGASEASIAAHVFDAGAERTAGEGTWPTSVDWDITLGGSTKLGTIPAYYTKRRVTLTEFEPGNVPNNTFYHHTASHKLKYKDNAGTTRIVVREQDPQRSVDPWKPTESKAENFSRLYGDMKNLATILTTKKVYMVAGLILPPDVTFSNIAFYSATQAAEIPTHQWAGIADVNRKILAISADKTTEAWGANTKKTFTFGTAYTQEAGKEAPVYAFLCVTAGTPPSLRGREHENTSPSSTAPILSGTSTETETPLAVGESLAAITATTKLPYVTLN